MLREQRPTYDHLRKPRKRTKRFEANTKRNAAEHSLTVGCNTSRYSKFQRFYKYFLPTKFRDHIRQSFTRDSPGFKGFKKLSPGVPQNSVQDAKYAGLFQVTKIHL
jgi:hypothetical protein